MNYFISIIIGTFILEDLALTSSIALIAENKINISQAFWACFLGISIGDVGLYLLGYLANYIQIEKYFSAIKKIKATLSKLQKSDALSYTIVVSRVLPGTRLPTYLTAGYVKYSFAKFLLLTILSVFAWVTFALLAGKSLSLIFKDHIILSLILFVFFMHVIKSIVPNLLNKWDRLAFFNSWRKWLHFEFWPGWFFYIPIIPYYIFLSAKHRSFLIPFYANPNLINGGLIGESKWDFLKHLEATDSHTLKTVQIPSHSNFTTAQNILLVNNLSYPFILKPDVGQRGFGVRIIRTDDDLSDYLKLSHFDLLAQRLSHLPCEAGLFYIRKPSESTGQIFSITDKKFPVVIGDGASMLGQLIINDPRAKIIASTYFARHKDHLDTVPAKGDEVQISECGNHCQGAIFLNGQNLYSKQLLEAVAAIATKIPDLYFGRFDVRYKDVVSIQEGQFEIVEVNGAGSEATHIWDSKTKLVEAYITLFKQWDILFKIGAEVKKTKIASNIQLKAFLKESIKVFFRKEDLSTSS